MPNVFRCVEIQPRFECVKRHDDLIALVDNVLQRGIVIYLEIIVFLLKYFSCMTLNEMAGKANVNEMSAVLRKHVLLS